WQFIYSTARTYGLRIDSYVDERLDVEKAVDAAARYLRDAYRIFGDWPLAISSYNCGAGNVNKAIRLAGKKDFWAVYDYLPRETRGYVPAFVGAMYAMTYSREYGLKPAEVGMPAATDTFIVRRNLHFKQVSEVAGIPMEDLKNLNPQYYNDIIPGNGGPCVLRVPYRWTAAFVDAHTDSLYAYKASEYLSAQVLKGIDEGANPYRRTAYRVKNGDYLGKIASRYHVSVAQIKKWNHLRSDRLRIGQVLYIYK
ncbi:MAG: LysM peptidoglycan-binding domain-containing protein, partial [Bacteroidales bacterium]|nr:LysM peptidoglycan-binding domain-containing protein [Bacteroidales bacterium]